MANRYFMIPKNGPLSYDLRQPAQDGKKAEVITLSRTRPTPISENSLAFPVAAEAVSRGDLIQTDVHGREIDLRMQAMELNMRQPPPPRSEVRYQPEPEPTPPRLAATPRKNAAPTMVHVNHQERDDLGVV